MNIMAFLERVFPAVLEASICGAVLAVIVFAVQAAFGRRLSARWRHLLWLPVVARLFMPAAPESPWSLFNAPKWFAGSERMSGTAIKIEYPLPATPSIAANPVPEEMPGAAAAPEREGQPARLDWMAIAAAVWALLALPIAARLTAGAAWMKWRLRASGSPDPAAERVLDEAMAMMGRGRRPSILESPMVGSPALFGVFRPKLLLPRGFSARFTRKELRDVLLHELAHLRRGDPWVNGLMGIAQAIHWFNPLAWLAFREIRKEREVACDEMVLLGAAPLERRSYGETILKLLEGVPVRKAAPGLVGIAEESFSAKERLRQIARAKRPPRLASFAGAALFAMLAAAGLTNAKPPAELKPAESAVQPARSGHTAALLNDARLLIEMGQLAEARAKLNELLGDSPENREAKEYLRLIEEREREQVVFELRIAEVNTEDEAPGAPPLKGVLTAAQMKELLAALERRTGVDILSAPKITTLSGRPARISFEPSVWFDLKGVSLSNGVIALKASGKRRNGEAEEVLFSEDARLYDGQTLIVGSLNRPVVQPSKREIPVLKDVPMLGRLFRSETPKRFSHVIYLIRAYRIDASGRRVYKDGNMPFDPNSVPERPKNRGENNSAEVQ